MTGKTYELTDLPSEMQHLLVEKCDLITRCRLRASSVSMNQLVASTKLFIPLVKIKELSNEGVLLKLTFKLFKDDYTLKFKKNSSGGTRICQSFRSEINIEESNPADEAVAFFKRMCLQKNVAIGELQIETSEKAVEMTRKFEEIMKNSGIGPKVKSICWNGSGDADVLWKFIDHCDKNALKELKVHGKEPVGDFNLFGRQSAIVKNLEKIEVKCSSSATDEEILSLNASVIYLKSENFTGDMVTRLIDKFVNTKSTGSTFFIESSEKSRLEMETIPSGFKQVKGNDGYKEYHHQLLDGKNTIVILRVSDDSVNLQVGNTKEHYWADKGKNYIDHPPDYDDDSSEYDIYDDYDDVENEYYGNPYDSDHEFDIYGGEVFDESDFDDEEEDQDNFY